MRQKVAVVEHHSPYKQPCWKCQNETSASRCEACQSLQDYRELSHFEIFGILPALAISEEALREKFYELSRQWHPDRYQARRGPEALFALRWTTALNKAYQTLRDPEARGRYLLTLSGFPLSNDNSTPVDLAETYFELQDVISSDRNAALNDFRVMLDRQLELSQSEWVSLGERWDANSDRSKVLSDLSRLLIRRKFLKSMLSDLEKRIGCLS